MVVEDLLQVEQDGLDHRKQYYVCTGRGESLVQLKKITDFFNNAFESHRDAAVKKFSQPIVRWSEEAERLKRIDRLKKRLDNKGLINWSTMLSNQSGSIRLHIENSIKFESECTRWFFYQLLNRYLELFRELYARPFALQILQEIFNVAIKNHLSFRFEKPVFLPKLANGEPAEEPENAEFDNIVHYELHDLTRFFIMRSEDPDYPVLEEQRDSLITAIAQIFQPDPYKYIGILRHHRALLDYDGMYKRRIDFAEAIYQPKSDSKKSGEG
jgi:hypothetical protein